MIAQELQTWIPWIRILRSMELALLVTVQSPTLWNFDLKYSQMHFCTSLTILPPSTTV
jgi:hypothetical protein